MAYPYTGNIVIAVNDPEDSEPIARATQFVADLATQFSAEDFLSVSFAFDLTVEGTVAVYAIPGSCSREVMVRLFNLASANPATWPEWEQE